MARAWVIALIASLVTGTTIGTTSCESPLPSSPKSPVSRTPSDGFGLFITPMEAEFGWSRGEIGLFLPRHLPTA